MDLIGVAFPTKGYSTLWGGIGYFIIWGGILGVEKISRASMGGSTTVSFFCVEKKSQMRLAFLD